MADEKVAIRHGRWETVPHKRVRICSVCLADEPYKFADDDVDVYEYCPHCGAKMDSKDGMSIIEKADKFLKSDCILDGHTDTDNVKAIVKGLMAEIKRLQPKKGEWEPMEDYDDVVYRCSACEEEWTLIEGTPFDNGMKFCPHCGADMRDSYHFVSNL